METDGKIGAIVIASSKFDHPELPDLDSAYDNGIAIRGLLLSKTIKVERENVRLLFNSKKDTILENIYDLSTEVSFLVIYYSGHGILSEDGNKNLATYLTTPNSNPDQIFINGISIVEINQAIKNAGLKVIVILDCCFSGNVFDDFKHNSYYLVSSSNNYEKSKYPPNELYSVFTEKLVQVIDSGIPNKPEFLSMRDVFLEVESVLENENMPIPRSASKGSVGEIGFILNVASKKEKNLNLFTLNNNEASLISYFMKGNEEELKQASRDMIFSENFGSGIHDVRFIFNRDKILKILFSAIIAGRNRCLSGARLIGKTTILKALGSELIQQFFKHSYGLYLDSIMFCYLDLSVVVDQRKFFFLIAKKTEYQKFGELSFENLITRLRDDNKKLTLLLDNYDSILKKDSFDEVFINNLRFYSAFDELTIIYSRTLGRKYTALEYRKKHYLFASTEQLEFIHSDKIYEFVFAPISKIVSRNFEFYSEKTEYLCGQHPFFLSIGRRILLGLFLEEKDDEKIINLLENKFNQEVIRIYNNWLNEFTPFELNQLNEFLTGSNSTSKILNEKLHSFIEYDSKSNAIKAFSRHFMDYFLMDYFPAQNQT